MFDDEKIASGVSLESMARAYTENLKTQGFYFIKLDSNAETETTVSEIMKTLKKLVFVYKTNRSEKSKEIMKQTDEIEGYIKKTFTYEEQAGVLKVSNFEEIIGLEANLILKLKYLGKISGKKEPEALAFSRLELFKDLFMFKS